MDDDLDPFELDGDSNPANEWAQDSNKRLLDELFDNVAAYRTTTNYRELMTFISQFRFYAPFNAMLVHIQKPGAKYVLPAHKWRKDYRRTIRAEAQPLIILQPFGPVMIVFDVSETEGRPLPPEIENPFAIRNGNIGREFDQTIQNAIRDGIRISEVRHGSTQAGFIKNAQNNSVQLEFRQGKFVPLNYELILNLNHDRALRYATLVHELGHLYCGHLGTPNEKWWPNRRGLSKEIREFEAESVAYLVCKRAGIEPPSDSYLSGYLENPGEIPKISLDRVLTAAGLIEQMGRDKLNLRKN